MAWTPPLPPRHRTWRIGGRDQPIERGGEVRTEIRRIGLALAKDVFEVHGVGEAERVVLRKRLRRGKVLELFAPLPACVVGMEACAGAHHGARKRPARGRDGRLMRLAGIGAATGPRRSLLGRGTDASLPRRQFAAWLGLVPRAYSSGGKIRRGRISTHGGAKLRTLLIHGARVV